MWEDSGGSQDSWISRLQPGPYMSAGFGEGGTQENGVGVGVSSDSLWTLVLTHTVPGTLCSPVGSGLCLLVLRTRGLCLDIQGHVCALACGTAWAEPGWGR